jgi:predicted enzyme related to lactoylglutathione lyase
MTTGSRQVHDFCWINVMTGEVAAARAFFADVLGWDFAELPGVPGGGLIKVGDALAGAFMDLAAPHFPPGTPAAIDVMIKVASVDQTVARLRALGGRADAVMDVFENGRMASCTDPTGAVFGLWQPKVQDGFTVDSHAHGAPGWFETLTTDRDRAVAFYSELFGWKAADSALVPGMKYTTFTLDGRPVAGAMQMDPRMSMGATSHWATSFSVDRADEVARRCTDAGGKVCLPVQEIPTVGRFALLQSPQGVSFQIIEWAP